jgi:hypothetical protein
MLAPRLELQRRDMKVMKPLSKEGLEGLRREHLGDLATRRDVPHEFAQSCHPGGRLKVEYLDGLVSIYCEECHRDVVAILVFPKSHRSPSVSGYGGAHWSLPTERI